MDTSHQFSRLLKATRRRWVIYLDKCFSSLGLTSSRWDALLEIAKSDRLLNQRELAGRIGIEGATLVHLLDGLADKGFVERVPDDIDRRTKRVQLTPSGRKLVAQINETASVARADILQDVSDEEQEMVVRVLSKVSARLDALLGGDLPETSDQPPPQEAKPAKRLARAAR